MGAVNHERSSCAIVQAFFQNTPDAHILIEYENAIITECNLATAQLLGLGKQHVIGLSIRDISAENQDLWEYNQSEEAALADDKSPACLFRKQINLALERGKVRFQWFLKREDNQELPCEIHLAKTTLVVGKYLVASLRESASIQKPEHHLIDINDRLNLAITASGLGIWQWDVTTGELLWSDRLFQMLGYEPQEFSPSFELWRQTLHPDEADSVLAALQEHIDNGAPYDFELRSKCKNGKYRWFRTSGVAKRNDQGQALNMAGLFDDIDHQKEVELANKRLLELLDASSDFIGQADIGKNLTYLNPAFKNLVGYGTPGRQFIPDWHPPEDLKKLDEVIFPHTLEHGSWRGEVNLIDADGNVVPCSLLELAHKNDKGEYETFSAIFRDISDQKAKEAELLKQTKISEHQSKLAAIGRLASGVGHEINNPLAIIKGYVEGSLFELKAQKTMEPAKLQGRFEKINSAIERISKITQGLRSFARNDTEDTEICSVGDMVHESCGLIQEIYLKDGIDLHVNNLRPFYKTFVSVNKGKFQQVLMNLLVNAKDAIEHVTSKKISIDLNKHNGFVHIDVSDSGVGIPDTIKDRIFDPFYTTKDVNKGTGLGLSFVQEYIEEMNGSVDFASSPGHSTTFFIKIPEANQRAKTKENATAEATSSNSSGALNILIVEDEEALREFYQSILELNGHKTRACKDGLEALKQFTESSCEYDVVLSDMRMPLMGGAELLKAIRANKAIKQPKFVLLSGGVDVDLMSEKDEMNRLSDGFLFKPFNADSLISKVDSLFS